MYTISLESISILTFRGHPVRSGYLFIFHEGESGMSHVQLSRQIFLNLEGGGGDKGNKFTLPFQFLTKTW